MNDQYHKLISRHAAGQPARTSLSQTLYKTSRHVSVKKVTWALHSINSLSKCRPFWWPSLGGQSHGSPHQHWALNHPHLLVAKPHPELKLLNFTTKQTSKALCTNPCSSLYSWNLWGDTKGNNGQPATYLIYLELIFLFFPLIYLFITISQIYSLSWDFYLSLFWKIFIPITIIYLERVQIK